MYEFRPMTESDLPLLHRWLNEPHVSRWWGEPAAQFDLVSGDLDEPAMEQFIVLEDGQPFAYLQCYRLTEWDSGFGEQPDGTRGIDLLIGKTEMLSHGHGSAFVRDFVQRQLAAGTPRIVTDPDPQNTRAIRAYEKAGFRQDRLVDTPDGRSLLMVCDSIASTP